METERTVHRADDVFTPTTPARLTFVERDALNDRLVNALITPGKQLVVYGHSGSGKTTLLVNKLHQLYEQHITTRCVQGLTFDQLVLDAFDQLNPFYTVETTSSRTAISVRGLQAQYLGITAQLGGSQTETAGQKISRLLPPQLTPQSLGRFIGAANACWILEDFHKIQESEKTKLAQMMKVFMDMADEYRQLKIVALGAVGTAREVVHYDPEMRNRVAEILVPLMAPAEIRSIIEKGEGLLNVALAPAVKDGIVRYSNGLASVCHHICLNLAFAAEVRQTLPETHHLSTVELGRAIEMYLAEASDTVKRAFDLAFRRKRGGKFDNCRLIIRALLEAPEDGATHAILLDLIRTSEPQYPAGNLSTYLKELQSETRGAIVRLDPTSGAYSFSDPLYRAFAAVLFREQETTRWGPMYELTLTDYTADVSVWNAVSQNVLIHYFPAEIGMSLGQLNPPAKVNIIVPGTPEWNKTPRR